MECQDCSLTQFFSWGFFFCCAESHSARNSAKLRPHCTISSAAVQRHQVCGLKLSLRAAAWAIEQPSDSSVPSQSTYWDPSAAASVQFPLSVALNGLLCVADFCFVCAQWRSALAALLSLTLSLHMYLPLSVCYVLCNPHFGSVIYLCNFLRAGCSWYYRN